MTVMLAVVASLAAIWHTVAVNDSIVKSEKRL